MSVFVIDQPNVGTRTHGLSGCGGRAGDLVLQLNRRIPYLPMRNQQVLPQNVNVKKEKMQLDTESDTAPFPVGRPTSHLVAINQVSPCHTASDSDSFWEKSIDISGMDYTFLPAGSQTAPLFERLWHIWFIHTGSYIKLPKIAGPLLSNAGEGTDQWPWDSP